MSTDTVDISRSPERLILTDVQRGADGVASSMVVGVELGSLTAGRDVVAHYKSGFADLAVFFADLARSGAAGAEPGLTSHLNTTFCSRLSTLEATLSFPLRCRIRNSMAPGRCAAS